jgi:galactofuranosylgalactofuranosylrhamnosyl-N-acetylglucosaminyl-diphospho-decaprenol beta-1,5/1,6-galactofuranosyltransferase
MLDPDPQRGTPDQERLLAQRVLFAAPFPEVPDDLYSCSAEGVIERARGQVVIQPHSQLSTNTYFGRFPASYWQRWTEVAQVEVSAVVLGAGRISVRASDSGGDVRTVATVTVEGAHDKQDNQVRLTASIDRFVDGGAMWLEASTGSAALVLDAVHWSVAQPRRVRPTAVVICTYNRPDDCLHTLRTLSLDGPTLSIVDTIYVVDQGNDTVESRSGFAGVQHDLGPRLQYLRQPNLGGAGGFTRGLYEVMELGQGGHANILLMDDDIMLEPDTVVRLATFANCTTAPAIIGGQMLYLLHPNQLHVGAEGTNLMTLRAGQPVQDALVHADLTRQRQDIRVDAEYNAWWACLIPSEVVAEIGYPLPLFFQWDDIEYGLRARANGYPTVTLAGAGVWHADFHWKDWDDWSRYFSFRNSLIVNALHGQPSRTGTARFLLKELLHY